MVGLAWLGLSLVQHGTMFDVGSFLLAERESLQQQHYALATMLLKASLVSQSREKFPNLICCPSCLGGFLNI